MLEEGTTWNEVVLVNGYPQCAGDSWKGSHNMQSQLVVQAYVKRNDVVAYVYFVNKRRVVRHSCIDVRGRVANNDCDACQEFKGRREDT